MSTPTGPMPAQEPAPSPRSRWPMIVAALLALGLGGYVLNMYYEPAPWLRDLFGSATTAEGSRTTDEPTTTAAHEPTVPATGEDDPAAPNDEAADEESNEETDEPTTDSVAGADSASQTGAPATNPSPSPTPSPTGDPDPTPTPRRPRSGGGGGGVVTTVVSGGGGAVPSYDPSPSPTPSPSPLPSPGTQTAGGFVHITATSGWADIYLGSRRLGRTPLHRELPVGSHRLRVLPYGQEPAETLTVEIENGFDESLEIDVGAPPPAQ